MTLFKYKAITNLRTVYEEEVLKIKYEKLFEFESPINIQKGDWVNRIDFDVCISESFSRSFEKAYGGYGNMFVKVRGRMIQRDTILLVVKG